jgi:hypothetical protein
MPVDLECLRTHSVSDSRTVGRRVDDERSHAWGRLPLSRRWVIGVAVALVAVVGAGGWLLVRGRQARVAVAHLQIDSSRLQGQLAGYDLTAAGRSLTAVRLDARRAHQLTGDPIWGIAAAVPVLGRDLRAARDVSSVLADLTTAARPLEPVLPHLDPKRTQASGGRVDTAALSSLAQTLPAISTSVSAGAVKIGQLNPHSLRPEMGSGVTRLNQALSTARGPLAEAVPVMKDLPAMLGGDRKRTWVVLLQQDAEARGTGGLVGAFAQVGADRGKLDLVTAQPRGVLDRGPSIPAREMPADLRSLWGRDLTEWAGFNASAHFPYTGRLVAAGWKARTGGQEPDYVAGVDQYVVSALLAGTGPVTVRGVTVGQGNAVDFLSRGVYQRWSDPHDVDAITTELVRSVFGRVTTGRFDLPALVKAMQEPVHQRRLLIWSRDEDVQRRIERLPVSGILPGDPGAFAMAVINNGGGNKLDAYLKVHTAYQPGVCSQGIRVGRITVTLTNTAPRSGLPDYVNVRTDLRQKGLTGEITHDGSNRVLLDLYGPVASSAALTTLDGQAVAPVVGRDNNHTVWRVAVPIAAGQRRTVGVVMSTRAVDGDAGTWPEVLTQPMVLPATVTNNQLRECSGTSVAAG